ncbi:hypothetical protein K440DRAFT_170190 [Wilcoxina mikolae CBS 423.85]|nr:hypothetical protein K440DRAFT_170190 [Wilcoxina mikolae CBS 423.85]
MASSKRSSALEQEKKLRNQGSRKSGEETAMVFLVCLVCGDSSTLSFFIAALVNGDASIAHPGTPFSLVSWQRELCMINNAMNFAQTYIHVRNTSALKHIGETSRAARFNLWRDEVSGDLQKSRLVSSRAEHYCMS